MEVYEDFDLSDAKETWIKTQASINDNVFVRNEIAYKYESMSSIIFLVLIITGAYSIFGVKREDFDCK